MYKRNPIISQILNTHKIQAEEIVTSSSSKLVKNVFKSTWEELNNGSINASTSSKKIMFNSVEIKGTVEKWINDFEVCIEDEEARFNRMEEPNFEKEMELINLQTDINFHILPEYSNLKQK